MPASCAIAAVGKSRPTQGISPVKTRSMCGRVALLRRAVRSAGTSEPLRVFSGASTTTYESIAS